MAKDTEQNDSKKSILGKIKEYGTAITTLAGVLVSVASGVVWLDSRYAHAQEIQKQIQVLNHDVAVVQQSNISQILSLRKNMIEDKMFELEFKSQANKITPVERAQYERFKRQYDEIESQLKLNAVTPIR